MRGKISLTVSYTHLDVYKRQIRGFIVISWMLPVTVTALVFKFMFGESSGIINTILMNLHLIKSPIGWLLKGNTAMVVLIIANSWVGIPFNMLLLTTGLNNIPGDVYEAAQMCIRDRTEREYSSGYEIFPVGNVTEKTVSTQSTSSFFVVGKFLWEFKL